MTLSLDKVLITGASSMIGKYANFGIRPSHDELDIRDEAKVIDFVKNAMPSAIIHLAAQTDMRYCEEHPKEANRMNGEATGSLVRAASVVGARFVYLSSNAVFDG